MNAVKDLLKSGKTVVGASASPSADMNFLGDSGFDFLLFDTQHAPVEIKQLGPAVQGLRGKKAAPIIRVSDNRPDLICFALDAGARGIIVPMVNTKQQAADMVKWCKYHPAGERSNAGMRGEWGEFKTYREYMDAVNEQVLIIPMIETIEATDNIDEILSVPGIDVLLVGPSDLSIALDVPLDYPSDTYQQALDKIAAACKNHGVVPGMYFIPPGMDPNFYVDKGFKFFTLPWNDWAVAGVQNGLSGINR
ncbi:MAG: aldolase/citrate lyase family protein [Chloroflexi bacterium]|nr:aldolase/citrate lyase family protein [Chloroflexota bacterium]MDA1003253.1 aldolase/citrate lyase family protein [Chloroflexota bacterium]